MLAPDAYGAIRIEKRENGVALATLNRPDKRNAVDDALATLNRPDKRNAVDDTMHHELGRLPRDADADPDVKVLLITGAGRAFCAGGDFSGGLTPNETMWLEARRVVDGMLDCQKPIITAVNGYAMGLGSTVAFLGDVVFAARSATFADTHVRMGIAAGDGGQVIWPLLMGVNRAKYYLMTGERIPAEEAERLGLVNFVVEDEALMERALELADRLAAGPGVAISASKVGVNQLIKMVSNLVLPLSLKLEERTMATEDFREAVMAFAEKREPQYKGR
jgi:enoyl-CoA hydratase